MRKVIQPELHPPAPSQDAGLLPESVALLEVTSEDPAYVAESALAGEGAGWRAADAGPQKIRLVLAASQTLRRMSLVFEETATKRTQEFTVRSSRHREVPFVEIVRLQWTFRPPAKVR